MAAKAKTKHYYSAHNIATFSDSYTARSCAWAMADNRETKGLIIQPPMWVSAELVYICVTAW